MGLKRGQKVVFAPKPFSMLNFPYVATIGKVTATAVRLKRNDREIGEGHEIENVMERILCIDGGHNEMKYVYDAAKEFHRDMKKEIQAAHDKYNERIEELRKQHMEL